MTASSFRPTKHSRAMCVGDEKKGSAIGGAKKKGASTLSRSPKKAGKFGSGRDLKRSSVMGLDSTHHEK